MTTGWPQISESRWPTARVITPVAPPAGKSTTTCTGRAGSGCWADARLRARRDGGVRHQDPVGMAGDLGQRLARPRRLVVADVERAPAEAAGRERIDQRRMVDQLGARAVDQVRTGLGVRQRLGADDAA